jgi:NarL family two-component system response regulator LiaR
VSDKIRVFVTDDHSIVRDGIRAVLALEPDMELVGEAENGRQAVAGTAQLEADVILMDLMMPEMDGIEATRQITARDPAARILVLTSFAADDKVFPAIRAGAQGYLLKEAGAEELLQAIRQVYAGESWLHPTVARRVLQEVTGRHDGQALTEEPLTERELEVLKLISKGRSNKEIGAELVISDATVRTHVSSILGKLHVASRTQAALFALREGLASLDEVGDFS